MLPVMHDMNLLVHLLSIHHTHGRGEEVEVKMNPGVGNVLSLAF